MSDARMPPRDPASMFEHLRDLGEEGYTEDLAAREGGMILCRHCGQERPAAEYGQGSFRRMEGASDPAEMSIVLGLTCPNCEAKGVLVLMYGPEAGPAESDVLLALGDRAETTPSPRIPGPEAQA